MVPDLGTRSGFHPRSERRVGESNSVERIGRIKNVRPSCSSRDVGEESLQTLGGSSTNILRTLVFYACF